MNFLAHAWLAGESSPDRLGGLMGDFVKGALPAGLPPDIARVSPERRRVAGVMVDMFYDHFLALHWQQFHDEPLERFSATMYALMDANDVLLPPRLAMILPRMRESDWLGSYRSADVIAMALDRMALRLRRANPLTGSGAELLADYAGFEADFFEFIAAAEAFAANSRALRGPG